MANPFIAIPERFTHMTVRQHGSPALRGRRLKGLLAAAAGFALLLSGSTFALWFDETDVAEVGSIKNGVLLGCYSSKTKWPALSLVKAIGMQAGSFR
jgi:hypothetical protein